MAALAQRIGTSLTASAPQAAVHQSSSAPMPQAAALHPHAAVHGKAPTSVSADSTVPPELQAIIQKLVAFIKVGPSGQAGCLMKQHTV